MTQLLYQEGLKVSNKIDASISIDALSPYFANYYVNSFSDLTE